MRHWWESFIISSAGRKVIHACTGTNVEHYKYFPDWPGWVYGSSAPKPLQMYYGSTVPNLASVIFRGMPKSSRNRQNSLLSV